MQEGHYVFRVDQRPNTWTHEIETLLQDLSVPYQRNEKGIGGVDYPKDLDVVVHLAPMPKKRDGRTARPR